MAIWGLLSRNWLKIWTCSLLRLICIHFISLLTKFHQDLSSSCRDIDRRSFKKVMKIGRFLGKITPWRRNAMKKWMTAVWKEIYRRFWISNQIFDSIYGSRDIARSLDTTFGNFWTLWMNISRTKKDFDMRFSRNAQKWSCLHSDQVSSKSLEPFLRKSRKSAILTTFLDFMDEPDFFLKIRQRHICPLFDV